MPSRLLAFVLLASAVAPAVAAEGEVWSAMPAEGGGLAVLFGVPGDAESMSFHAQCPAKGEPVEIWYHAEREVLPGQKRDAGGTRQRLEPVAVAVVVDGRRFDYPGAAVQPEELAGGNEVTWSTRPDDPLFEAMRSGRTLSLMIAGEAGGSISLKGSAKPIATLIAACRG
jgi:hypothetical protein